MAGSSKTYVGSKKNTRPTLSYGVPWESRSLETLRLLYIPQRRRPLSRGIPGPSHAGAAPDRPLRSAVFLCEPEPVPRLHPVSVGNRAGLHTAAVFRLHFHQSQGARPRLHRNAVRAHRDDGAWHRDFRRSAVTVGHQLCPPTADPLPSPKREG